MVAEPFWETMLRVVVGRSSVRFRIFSLTLRREHEASHRSRSILKLSLVVRHAGYKATIRVTCSFSFLANRSSIQRMPSLVRL